MSDGPLLLVLDTSTKIGCVGLGRGPRLLVSHRLAEERSQASGLVPAIASVLASAEAERGQVRGIVVGRGPGSFTGVRVAAATARGLAHGLGIPVWGVSSLAAAAFSSDQMETEYAVSGADLEPVGTDELRPRYVLFDARSDRVYAGCYRPVRITGAADGMEVVLPPVATVLDSVLDDAPEGSVFCGDAALRHADRIRAAGFAVAAPPLGWPSAVGLLRARAALGGDPLERGWEPEYLRGSSARPSVPAGGHT